MGTLWRVVETDNFGGDYPDEKFATPYALPEMVAERVALALNDAMSGPDARRFWKIVPDGYALQPGFEP